MTCWNPSCFLALDDIVLPIVSMSERSFLTKFKVLYNTELNLSDISLRSRIINLKISSSSLIRVEYVLIELACQC